MDPEQNLAAIARRQRGHVTLEQVVAAGLTPSQITRRCKSKGWIRVLPRVYRLPGVQDDLAGRYMATRLWLGGNGFFTGPSGAHLLRLDGFTGRHRITVACTTTARLPGWIKVIRLTAEDRPPLRNVSGFRLPTTERVLVDLVRLSSAKEVGSALDDALRRGMTSVAGLKAFLANERRRQGAAVLREMLRVRDDQDEKVRSDFETRTLRILRRIREDRVVPDHEVQVEGRTFFLDFFFPKARLAVECQSLRFHAGHDWLVRDLKRDRALKRAGIEVIYFTWDEVVGDPAGVEAEVRTALLSRLALDQLPFDVRT